MAKQVAVPTKKNGGTVKEKIEASKILDQSEIRDVNVEGLDFDNEEQISFPPYWKPEVGLAIIASALALDTRNPEFHRYLLQAAHDIECFSGPGDEAEEVTVRAGEYFTTSVYAGLPLSMFMGLPDPIKITVKGMRRIQDPEKNDMFVFGVKTTDRCKTIMQARRANPNTELPMGMVRPQLDAAEAE